MPTTSLETKQARLHGLVDAVDYETDEILGSWPNTPLGRLAAVRWLRDLDVPTGLRSIQIMSPDGFEDASREDIPGSDTIFEVRGPTFRDCAPLANAEEADWLAAHEVDGYSEDEESA